MEHHGNICHHRNTWRGMVYLYRLAAGLLLVFFAALPTAVTAETTPATATTNPTGVMWQMSFSSGPDAGKTRIYAAAVLACQAGVVNYGASMSSYVTTNVSGSTASCVYGPPGLPYQGSWGTSTSGNSCVTSGALSTASCVTYSCPANQNWTLSGQQCTRPDCVAPATRDPATGQCKGPCDAGQPVTSTADSPWYQSGDLVSGYSFQTSVITTPGCVSRSGTGCTVTWGSPNASPRENRGSNGHSFFTVYLNGTTTGQVCSPPAPAGQPPEPACAGQSGMVNGVNVCLPPETPAQRDERINNAARAAAAAASQNASNQGASPARAAAAAAAAGAAARSCLQDPSCSASSASAAASAAAAASLAATATPTTPATAAAAAAAAASVEQQVTQRASSISSAANLNSAQTAATIEAARTAGMTAYNNALAAGLSQEVAVNAARVAGQAATASSIYGATPQATAAAAAAAAAAETAGNPNATPGPVGAASGAGSSSPTPVDDFCKRNPQAAMCRNQFDSKFGGACGAPPVCSGDAIMCAVAAATFATNCALTTPPAADTADLTLFKSEALKPQGDQTLSNMRVMNIGPSSFDQANMLPTGVGMSDVSIVVARTSVTLPLSMINPWLVHLGTVLKVLTFLICARILFKR